MRRALPRLPTVLSPLSASYPLKSVTASADFLFSVFLISTAHGLPDLHLRQTSSVKGDSTCGNSLCVSATVNGSTTSYVLSSLGNTKVGWMAIGFGSQMVNTPMVIMWMNSDGTATLSQRKASSEAMPTVDSSPSRTATLATGLSVLSTAKPTLAFQVATNSDTTQQLIYALGTTNPGSSAVNAALIQHVDYGVIQLDLSKTPTSTSTGSSSTSTSYGTGSGSDSGSLEIPLKDYEKLIIAHAILCVIGFLLVLPAGALLARYLRTFVAGPVWFKSHAFIQFFIGGPIILVGVMLGVGAVSKSGALHLDDDHKRWGIAIFVLYLFQCLLGAFIHYVKEKNRVRRPPQNYTHAILGLLVIAFALYQVHSGYDTEWPLTTGRDPLPPAVNVLFWVWVALLPILYGAGLAFLPKQYRQERNSRSAQRRDYNGQYDLKQRT